MDVYKERVGGDSGDVLCDLLADLRHWADCYGFDFDAELIRACGHYEAELEEDDQAEFEALERSARTFR